MVPTDDAVGAVEVPEEAHGIQRPRFNMYSTAPGADTGKVVKRETE